MQVGKAKAFRSFPTCRERVERPHLPLKVPGTHSVFSFITYHPYFIVQFFNINPSIQFFILINLYFFGLWNSASAADASPPFKECYSYDDLSIAVAVD